MIDQRTRHFCAAEGCHANTQKKGRYGYIADMNFFPLPTYPLPPPSLRVQLVEIVHTILCSFGHALLKTHRSCSYCLFW